jgi:hypothetical protein
MRGLHALFGQYHPSPPLIANIVKEIIREQNAELNEINAILREPSAVDGILRTLEQHANRRSRRCYY